MLAARGQGRRWTPCQIAALVFGIWWIGNFVAVFAAVHPSPATLGMDGDVHVLGLSIAVNGWHGLFHLATGVAGVGVCWWPRSARAYALAAGLIYMAAALSTVITGSTVFSVIHVDEIGSADHAVEGVALLAAWLASSNPVVPARARVLPHGAES